MRQRIPPKPSGAGSIGSVNSAAATVATAAVPASQLDPKGKLAGAAAGGIDISIGRWSGAVRSVCACGAGLGDSAQIISGTATAKTMMKLSMTAAHLRA